MEEPDPTPAAEQAPCGGVDNVPSPIDEKPPIEHVLLPSSTHLTEEQSPTPAAEQAPHGVARDTAVVDEFSFVNKKTLTENVPYSTRISPPKGYCIIAISSRIAWAQKIAEPRAHFLPRKESLLYISIPNNPQPDAPPLAWYKTRFTTDEIIRGAATFDNSATDVLFYLTSSDTVGVVYLIGFDGTDGCNGAEGAPPTINYATTEFADLTDTTTDKAIDYPVWNVYLIPLSIRSLICSVNHGRTFHLIHFPSISDTVAVRTCVELTALKDAGAAVASQPYRHPDGRVTVVFLADPVGNYSAMFTLIYTPSTCMHLLVCDSIGMPEPADGKPYNPAKPDMSPALFLHLFTDPTDDRFLVIVTLRCVWMYNITRKCATSMAPANAIGIATMPTNTGVYIADPTGYIYSIDTYPPMPTADEAPDAPYEITMISLYDRRKISLYFNLIQASILHATPTHFILHPSRTDLVVMHHNNIIFPEKPTDGPLKDYEHPHFQPNTIPCNPSTLSDSPS